MLLGIVSDSHGHVPNTRRAVRMLESLKVDVVLHCGDIGSIPIVEWFTAWPTHFVFGNVDYEQAELERAIRAAGQTCHRELGRLRLGERRVSFLHSHDAKLFREVIADDRSDLVCYGHTHRAEWHDVGKTRVLNPGALYRATPQTLAIVDLDTLEPTIVPV